jgi:hypothetical protein
VREREWAVAYRHYKAVEEKQMNRERKRDSAMDRFVINPNDDDTIESSIMSDEEDLKGVTQSPVTASTPLINIIMDHLRD